MRDPCEICMERDRCAGRQPCKKKTAYGRYKEKCKEIAEQTKERMNNESRTQNIT